VAAGELLDGQRPRGFGQPTAQVAVQRGGVKLLVGSDW